jgi:hypothetical protein
LNDNSASLSEMSMAHTFRGPALGLLKRAQRSIMRSSKWALRCPRYSTHYVQYEQAEALAAQPRSSYCVKRF